MSEAASPRVVAVVRDLFFAVRIKQTLRQHGYEVAIAADDGALSAALVSPAALVIVDLNHPALDPPALIARLKGDPATAALPILAFGSHLDQRSRNAARMAGADRVVANSKLADDLPALVSRYARPSG